GSSDLKIAFKKCGKEEYFKKVRGWYNIGGLNKGSRLVQEIDGNWGDQLEKLLVIIMAANPKPSYRITIKNP
ncbi:MAG: hypothetical protein ACK59W_13620, partial [Pseudanabaena sp.]